MENEVDTEKAHIDNAANTQEASKDNSSEIPPIPESSSQKSEPEKIVETAVVPPGNSEEVPAQTEKNKIVNDKLDAIQSALVALSKDFENKIKYDKHRETVIDNLHSELQEYKLDPIKKTVKPILMDIIHVIDDIVKLVNFYNTQDQATLEPQKILRQLADFSPNLEEILFRHGVEPFTSELGSKYDRYLHEILKKTEVDDEPRDKTLAESLRRGYRWEGKVLRAEAISLYVYKKPTNVKEIQISVIEEGKGGTDK